MVKDNISLGLDEPKKSELSLTKDDSNFVESNMAAESAGETGGGGGCGDEEDNVHEEELEEKGSVRRFVSFLGRGYGVSGLMK
ncbi:UNVERIFIED_CONTAM: hypothetical protein Sradi_2226600 [Sesamum radiatum]|uniref:Uncharacterized protein n=1 Tax=Sesamum radiatum TaxID=300843 RepID=A0AAW2T229_SESRA